jgi:PKD repeat protein
MPVGMKRGLPPLLAILAAGPGMGCETTNAVFADAGPDLPPADAILPPSDAPVTLAVDFTVENCPAFNPVALTCTGQVPLAIRFVPLATTTVTKYLWNFGDGPDFASDAAPDHVYATPGVYTVTIIATGMGGGLVSKVHAGFIIVQANGPGETCDNSGQCNDGLSCFCGDGCASGPARGLCASTCASGLCGRGQVCAGLLTAAPPLFTEPWQTNLCLAACAEETDCPQGLHCRTLPPGPAGSAWVHGCFSRLPADIGEPCRDSNGNLRDDLCATGLCADLGAAGMCSLDCQKASCPSGSDCAVLGDGRTLCLRSCTHYACGNDSLLTCVGPSSGDLGYQLVSQTSSNASSSYCAPKACSADDSANDICMPSGFCSAPTGSGHCVRRP